MKVSFARQVKEEVVFNDFDICCQKLFYQQLLKSMEHFLYQIKVYYLQ